MARSVERRQAVRGRVQVAARRRALVPDGASNLLQGLGVLEGREVARVPPSAFARTARRTIFALRVFGSAVTNTTWSARTPCRARPAASRAHLRRSSSTARRRASAQNTHTTSPFTSCGHADRGGLSDRGVRPRSTRTQRADALARDVDRVVGATVQVPQAVRVDRRPVAVLPHAGQAASTSRGSARDRPRNRGSCPATASCTRARRPRPARAAPVGVPHVDAHPEAGAAERARLERGGRRGREEARATSVPPEQLMIGQRPPPTTSKSHCHGSGFHGSPVVPKMRSVERSGR